jgi:predicted Zn finger-like uncharacterized protein
MALLVTCDHCKSPLQVLDEHAGKPVRCPKCYQVFTAQPSSAAGAASPGIAGIPAPAPPPPASGPVGCPRCGAPAPAGGARFCPSCGGDLAGSGPPAAVVSAPSMANQVPVSYGGQTGKCGLATASLICGIVSFCVGGPILGIVAVVMGHMAKRQIRESGGALEGDQNATIGLILGYIQIVLGCLLGAFWVTMLSKAGGGRPPF